ncbi:MAG: hypothetical protein JWP85_297 [Rhodoglobus sp.]|nr:hypothetical protein [Rhodoglobus sp.]
MERADSDRSDRATLTLALIVTLLVQFAQHGARPMASYRALGLDASVEQLGFLALSFGALAIVTAIPVGRLVDQRGARATTVGGVALLGGAAVAHSLVTDLVGLIVAHTVLGLGVIFAVVGLQAIVGNAGPSQGADARFGLFGAAVSLGQVLGPIVGGGMAELLTAAMLEGPTDPFGTAPMFVLAGVLCTAAAITALALPRFPGGTREARLRVSVAGAKPAGFGSVLRAPHMGKALWASMVVLTATDALTVYLPAIGAERGWSVGLVSVLLAVRAALAFAVRVGTAPLVRRLGRRPLLVGASLIGAVALFLMAPDLPPWAAVLLMAITGLTLGIGQPLTMAWVSRSAPGELRATALATRITANRIGQSLIPVVVGGVAAIVGSGAIFVILSALLVSTSVAVSRSNLR